VLLGIQPVISQKDQGLGYYLQQGESAFAKHDYHSAIYYFRKALKINPSFADAQSALERLLAGEE